MTIDIRWQHPRTSSFTTAVELNKMMTTKQKLVWRLKEQPTSENLRELVKDGILSKDEAREVLFSSETEEDRDKESLKSEIKFLRELIEKLANRSQIITTIREIELPVFRKTPWYPTYVTWCGGTSGGGDTYSVSVGSQNTSFSDIRTF